MTRRGTDQKHNFNLQSSGSGFPNLHKHQPSNLAEATTPAYTELGGFKKRDSIVNTGTETITWAQFQGH